MKLKTLVYLSALTVFSTALVSQTTKIYKTVNEDGSVSFSDKYSEGAILVELNVNTAIVQSQKVPVKPQVKLKESPVYNVSITQPKDKATIRNNAGIVTIGAKVEPAAAGLYRLSFSGKEIDSTTGQFKLENVNRGTHQYQVSFVSNSGKLIALSPQQELYLHRASKLIN